MNRNPDEMVESLFLSQEEVWATLEVLEARMIPGLDQESWARLAAPQRQLLLAAAGRALQARGLAQRRADGELLLHRTLLAAVGVCAYSQSAVLLYHWPSGSSGPVPFFGHVRGSDAVAHTQPTPGLHRLTLLPSKEHLVEQMLAACEYSETPNPQPLELSLSSEGLSEVRLAAEGGDRRGAEQRLTSEGASTAAAQSLVQALAAAPRVSIFQTLKQENGDGLRSREVTLIQDGQQAWFLMPDAGGSAGTLAARSATTAEIRDALATWL